MLKINLSYNQVKRLKAKGNLVPVFVEFFADCETPVSAFSKIAAKKKNSFLLESVEGGKKISRYSFIGVECPKIFKFNKNRVSIIQKNKTIKKEFKDPLEIIKKEMIRYQLVGLPNLPRFQGGLVGYFSYDAVKYFEKINMPESDPIGAPEGIFLFTDTLVVFDHIKHKIIVISHVYLDKNSEENYKNAVRKINRIIALLQTPKILPYLNPCDPKRNDVKISSNFTKKEYMKIVEEALEEIRKGEIFQVVLSQRFKTQIKVDSFNVYRALRSVNPSPYMFYFRFDDFDLAGASPEILVRVDDGNILLRPMAGTRKRGKDEEEDKKLETELLNDEKEIAEHSMLVDLARNDVGRVAQIGTVKFEPLMYIEKYSHVQHIVSDITGRIDSNKDIYDVFRSCLPAGTLSGAPKIRAMEIISRLEKDKRGIYGGAVGYFDFSGNMDTCITIRTILIKNNEAYFQVGSGIVHDSVPENEYKECLKKTGGSLSALKAIY